MKCVWFPINRNISYPFTLKGPSLYHSLKGVKRMFLGIKGEWVFPIKDLKKSHLEPR